MTAEIKKYSDAGLWNIQGEFKHRYEKHWLLLGGLVVCFAIGSNRLTLSPKTLHT